METQQNAESRIKEMPKSLEAEQAVIGALLLDNARWDDVAEQVVAEDFFYHNNRVIFQALSELFMRNDPFDLATLSNCLRDKNQLEGVGGVEYLRKLAEETPSALNAVAYARIVREQGIKRRLISASSEIANSAYFSEGRDVRIILDNAEQRVFAIAEAYENNTRGGLLPISKVAAEALRYIEELKKNNSPVTGVSTGFRDLDEKTAGLQSGDLIIIAGRPSMGKTAFALNIVEAVALGARLPVAVFSLEMPARSLVMRMLSSLSLIPQDKIRRGIIDTSQDISKFTYAVQQLHDAPIFIDDGSNLSAVELRARVRRLKRDKGDLGLVVVDYLQLMQINDSNDSNRATQMGDISRALKLLAKEIDVPIIALSQLNRALETRTKKRPIMSDIRESGAIEQDADVIMFIYRDEVYNPSTDRKNIAEIIIGKQRNGPIGTVPLSFRGEYMHFRDLAPGEMLDWEDPCDP